MWIKSNICFIFITLTNIYIGMNDEFIIKELLDRIVNLKKRIDRLFFLLITAIIFAIANLKDFKDIDIGGIIISDDTKYHLIMWVILSVLFGMIGAHLIDYVTKRSELDKLLNTHSNENGRDSVTSRQLIPGSFFEFIYMLKPKSERLRYVSIYGLLCCLFFGHFFGLRHLYIALEDYSSIGVVAVIVSLSMYLLHYVVFIKSIKKAKNDLGNLLLKHLLISAGLTVLILLLTNFIDPIL
ncbi:hypothetical protein ALE3EI_0311 [Constantimarinum furrinae]|uniref:Uncharacterized protein n=2 Tax=Constantimarinum furrinae TaxID=2562285 RepID=A0A7G8PRD2_9FLAO|nr:hypothetical protein ALE3EI_0311 [Constantimarinum furrinae]